MSATAGLIILLVILCIAIAVRLVLGGVNANDDDTATTKAGPRARGTGGIYHDKPKGKWRFSIDEKGWRYRRYFETKQEAESHADWLLALPKRQRSRVFRESGYKNNHNAKRGASKMSRKMIEVHAAIGQHPEILRLQQETRNLPRSDRQRILMRARWAIYRQSQNSAKVIEQPQVRKSANGAAHPAH